MTVIVMRFSGNANANELAESLVAGIIGAQFLWLANRESRNYY